VSASPTIDVSGCSRRLSEGIIGSDIPGEVDEFEGSYEGWNASARYLQTKKEVEKEFTKEEVEKEFIKEEVEQEFTREEVEKEFAKLAEADKPMTKEELLGMALDFIKMYDLDKDGKLSELEMLEEMIEDEDYNPPDGYEELHEEKEPDIERSKFHSHFLAADGAQRGDGALDAEELVKFFEAFHTSYLDFAETQNDEPDENNQDTEDNRDRRLRGNDTVDEVDEIDDINV